MLLHGLIVPHTQKASEEGSTSLTQVYPLIDLQCSQEVVQEKKKFLLEQASTLSFHAFPYSPFESSAVSPTESTLSLLHFSLILHLLKLSLQRLILKM